MDSHLLVSRQVIQMILRPADPSGDILPVLSASDLVSGPEAVVLLVRDRLNLHAGEWWENPAWGCGVFDMIRSGRVTGQDVAALASALSSYIAATPGVQSVEDVRADVSGRRFTYACRVLTESGDGTVSWSASL